MPTTSSSPNSKAFFSHFRYEGKDDFYSNNELSSNQFYNPILPGFYPDPSICKKGDDFYLVTSSFSFFPGIPIFRSTDLMHWQQLGHVLNRPDHLNLEGLDISQGIFAPDISYNKANDSFYLICTLVGGIENFLVKAKDPAGPWSDPILLPEIEGFDPALFFDEDGKAYIVHNSTPDEKSRYDGHRTIRMWEYDVAMDKVIGEGKIIVNGGTDLSKNPIWIEGPHLYKIEGKYYLMCAEGGTAENHSEVIFRSKEVGGSYMPYEQNPILSQRQLNPKREKPITCTGHADMIEDKNGKWWGVFLGCRPYDDDCFNTGRESFLVPVSWKNGWPLFLETDRKVELIQENTGLPSTNNAADCVPNGNFIHTDNFDSEELIADWNFIRTPYNKCYVINTKQKRLELESLPVNIRDFGQPAFIGRRQQHTNFEAQVELDFHPSKDQEAAGLVCFQNEAHHFFFGKLQDDGRIFLQLEKAVPYENGVAKVLIEKSELFAEGSIKLKIEGKGRYYDFYYSLDAENWIIFGENIDARLLSTMVAGGFVGTYIGMYASSNH
ncbi:glycoside hydrolase family 43 protein [Labilibaculum sp.]|uniref:glycoside hydrolase family 43 protein n=1 Tax=Labilibaculum sp. TaxID=2060723 RepID=UPI00356650E3